MSNLRERFEQLSNRNRSQVWTDRYQYFISIIATFLFFSEFPDYLHVSSRLPVVPLIWIYVFAILSLPFIKKIRNVPKPLLIWIAVYLGVSVLSLMTVSSDEISFTDFRAKVLSVLFILLMHAIYQQKSLTHVKYTIVAVVMLTCFNNLVELFNPRFFTELNVGRPAGFYVDPNKTGCALMLGTIFGINVIKKEYRWIYILISGIGVLTTFSRGAMIGWVICVGILIAGKVISDQRHKVLIPAVLLLLLLISINPLESLTDYFKSSNEAGSNYDIIKRLEEFQNPSANEDSASERQAVATGGWLMFGRHPFWGNGLASTRKWNISEVSTHNMYLYFMADHGIIGMIFLPGAVFGVVYANRGEQRTILICFTVFISLWGFFSHEVLAERYILSMFAFTAAMNTNQQRYLSRLPAPRNQKMLPYNTNLSSRSSYLD
jgi:O-Antigen ligase